MYNTLLKLTQSHSVPDSPEHLALSLHLLHASFHSYRLNITTAGEVLNMQPSGGNQVIQSLPGGYF